MFWIRNVRDYFISDNYPEPGINRKISLTFYLLFLGGIVTLILPFVYLAIGFREGLVFSSLGTLLALTMLYGIKRGVNYVVMGNFCAFSVILDLGALVIFTGGIFSPALIWLLFAPVTGYLLTNNFSGAFWSFITLVLIIFLSVAGFFGIEFPNFIPQDYWSLITAFNFVFSISILLFIVFSYERNQAVAIDEVDELNRELRLKSIESSELNKNLEQMVEERTEELQRINKELDHFSYSISHNLRAPLSSILGLVELSRQEPNDVNKYLDMIQESTAKLDKTIHSINSYLKINRGEIVKKRFLLKESLKEIVQDLSFSNMARKISISLDIEDNYMVTTDPERFKIIFSNIISNAIKYSDPEKKLRSIKIRGKSEEGGTIISVLDNGIGIEDEKKDRIFEMFYRGTQRSKGDGLGLYIVKEALASLSASIQFESKEKEGTEFIVRMPE